MAHEQKNITSKTNQDAGWIISESIMLELDLILSVINGYIDPDSFEDISSFMNTVPEELLTGLRELLPGNKQLIFSLSKMAMLKDTMFKSDYKTASLAIRKMTISECIHILSDRMKSSMIKPDKKLDSLDQLIEIMVRIEHYSDQQTGFETQKPVTEKNVIDTMTFCSKIMRNGELEYDFWHCLDRFYYEVYLPWRNDHGDIIEKQKEKALKTLGIAESIDSYPDHDALISLNPIFHRPGLIAGLSKLKSRLHFVAIPLKFFDIAHVEPGYGLFTLTESAWKHDRWVNRIDDISKITKAISDPTRLSILRMVRGSGKYTTELASFLNISRPTVSEHCKILRNAGLIETYSEGRKNYHQLIPENVRQLFQELEHFLDLTD